MKVAHQHLMMDDATIPLLGLRSVFVLAVGKAAIPMMCATLESLREFQIRGIVAT